MSHGDQVQTISDQFVPLASTEACMLAAVKHRARALYGLQFHPEVTHTPDGKTILANFLTNVCHCEGTWRLGDFAEQTIRQVRERVGNDRVICGLAGGLPAELGFELIEPLRHLFKDEVRQLGLQLGVPEEIVWRHPFPGPGLAVRCLGEVKPERLETLREADAIVVAEIKAEKLYRSTSQAFAVLLPIQSVGVMGDARTYDDVIAVRCVTTDDFMTADWTHLPHDLLARISTRIINEVKGVNRVVYDISSKPPATIEWE